MPAPDIDLAARGRAVAPDFVLDAEIGRGGMGVVYRALDVTLDRTVAIKMLLGPLADIPDVRARFLREARAGGKLSHPNIVPVHRAEERADAVFFVMAYVDGPSLDQELAQHGPMDAARVSGILRDVALALDHAHRAGVIHRDIKPENILLDRATGAPRVTDFGIARVVGAAPHTKSGQTLGSVHYMSPEQVRGDPLDGRSDLYALGAVGFRLLTGGVPFDQPIESAVLVAHVMAPAPKVRDVRPSVPVALAAVIDRCLEKEASARFATGAAMAAALDAVLDAAPDALIHDGGAAPAPTFSEQEAMAVWARAAELQAETGPHVAVDPAAFNAERGRARPGWTSAESRSGSYELADVLAAAAEADIPAWLVERAIDELRARQPAPAPTAATTPTATAERRLLGAAKSIVVEAHLAREVGAEDYEVLIELVRRRLGDPGHVGAFKSAMTWSASADRRQVHVSITSRDGCSTIRIEESLTRPASLLSWFVVGGGGAAAAAEVWWLNA